MKQDYNLQIFITICEVVIESSTTDGDGNSGIVIKTSRVSGQVEDTSPHSKHTIHVEHLADVATILNDRGYRTKQGEYFSKNNLSKAIQRTRKKHTKDKLQGLIPIDHLNGDREFFIEASKKEDKDYITGMFRNLRSSGSGRSYINSYGV
jgi:hypothetical protein